jgi:hypothetical protein
MELRLEINANAETAVFPTGRDTGTLSIVGLVTTETVAVQIPRVAHPVTATDAHWTNLIQDGDAVQLDVNNNAIRVPGNLLVRLKKDAGVASNAYGVRFS